MSNRYSNQAPSAATAERVAYARQLASAMEKHPASKAENMHWTRFDAAAGLKRIVALDPAWADAPTWQQASRILAGMGYDA